MMLRVRVRGTYDGIPCVAVVNGMIVYMLVNHIYAIIVYIPSIYYWFVFMSQANSGSEPDDAPENEPAPEDAGRNVGATPDRCPSEEPIIRKGYAAEFSHMMREIDDERHSEQTGVWLQFVLCMHVLPLPRYR